MTTCLLPSLQKQYSPLLAAFTTQGQSELTLLLKIQEYCYDNIHFMKAFQKIVVLFYKGNSDFQFCEYILIKIIKYSILVNSYLNISSLKYFTLITEFSCLSELVLFTALMSKHF